MSTDLRMTERRLDLLRAVGRGHVFRFLYSCVAEASRVYLDPPPHDQPRTVTAAAEDLVEAGLAELGDKPESYGHRWRYKLTGAGEAALAEVSNVD